MRRVRVAVIGHPRSGKTSVARCLHQFIIKRDSDKGEYGFDLSDVGERVPSELFHEFDFVVFTFDLTASFESDSNSRTTYDLLSAEIDPTMLSRVCMVGIKWDLVPQTSLDIAVSLYEPMRELALSCPILKIFPLSTATFAGRTELALHIVNSVTPMIPQRPPFKETFVTWVTGVGTRILDAVAELLSLPVPADVNTPTPDPCEMNDTLVKDLITSAEAREWNAALAKYASSWGCSHIQKITPQLLVKPRSASGLSAMNYVRSHTRIPVPQPRYPHLSWLAMDFVEGRMLLECWESQSWWMKLRIACTLRGYIRQLRQLKGTRPGPLDDGVISNNTLFDDQACGPFSGSTSFRVWCERVSHGGWVRWIKYCRSQNFPLDEDPPYPVIGGEWPLVFTHCDLNLSNIILSKDNVLWIVDWNTGGFFPPWLESIGIKYSEPPASFARFIGFICGSYPEYDNFWGWFMSDVHKSYWRPRF